MSIEFQCRACNKVLRTGDDKAGARAKCPECGETVVVPAVGGDALGVRMPSDDAGTAGETSAGPISSPMQPPAGDPGMKTCPMCGESIRAKARKCRFCGEMLQTTADMIDPTLPSTKIQAGEVLATSWKVFTSQAGLCIGGYLLLTVLYFAAGLVMLVVQTIVLGQLGIGGVQPGGPFGPGRPPGLQLMVRQLFIAYIFGLVGRLIYSYIDAGQTIFFLNLARGSNPEIGNLFAGGPYYGRVLVCSVLMSVMVMAGLLLIVIPAIFVALAFWPYLYVIVDQDEPGLGGLGRAKEITSGNWGAVFVLALAVIGIGIGFVIAILVCAAVLALAGPLAIILVFLIALAAVIVVSPFITLIFAVAYCRMTGQATAVDRPQSTFDGGAYGY